MSDAVLNYDLVEKSFEKVRENKDTFALSFYENLFNEAPNGDIHP